MAIFRIYGQSTAKRSIPFTRANALETDPSPSLGPTHWEPILPLRGSWIVFHALEVFSIQQANTKGRGALYAILGLPRDCPSAGPGHSLARASSPRMFDVRMVPDSHPVTLAAGCANGARLPSCDIGCWILVVRNGWATAWDGLWMEAQFGEARCAMLLVRDPHLRWFFALPSLKDPPTPRLRWTMRLGRAKTILGVSRHAHRSLGEGGTRTLPPLALRTKLLPSCGLGRKRQHPCSARVG